MAKKATKRAKKSRKVTQADIAGALTVIGMWSGAVAGELMATGSQRSSKKPLHIKKVRRNPGTQYVANPDSEIATQISIQSAGIGKTC